MKYWKIATLNEERAEILCFPFFLRLVCIHQPWIFKNDLNSSLCVSLFIFYDALIIFLMYTVRIYKVPFYLLLHLTSTKFWNKLSSSLFWWYRKNMLKCLPRVLGNVNFLILLLQIWNFNSFHSTTINQI